MDNRVKGGLSLLLLALAIAVAVHKAQERSQPTKLERFLTDHCSTEEHCGSLDTTVSLEKLEADRAKRSN